LAERNGRERILFLITGGGRLPRKGARSEGASAADRRKRPTRENFYEATLDLERGDLGNSGEKANKVRAKIGAAGGKGKKGVLYPRQIAKKEEMTVGGKILGENKDLPNEGIGKGGKGTLIVRTTDHALRGRREEQEGGVRNLGPATEQELLREEPP